MDDDSIYRQQVLEMMADGQRQTADGINQLTDRLDTLADSMRDDSGQATGAAVVALDSEQWEALTFQLSDSRQMGSLSLFLSLLCVCLVSALLGTRLFALLSEGWRR